MSTSGGLGPLLQGISQQAVRIRAQGTVTDQGNYISDVVRGLTARPAVAELASFLKHTTTDYSFMDVALGGQYFVVGYKPGALEMWSLDGTPQTVTVDTADGADPLSYLGTDMRPYVFDNKIHLTNRDKIVEVSPDTAEDTVASGVGVAFCLGGIFLRPYTVTINYADGTVVTGTYVTPDGSNNGHARLTASDWIMQKVYEELLAQPELKPSTTLTHVNDSILIEDDTVAFSLSALDGEDNTSIRVLTDRVEGVEDLSETAVHGMLVRVSGSDEGIEDDYYMRFNSDISDVIGEGFGSDGVWEEWFNVYEPYQFDLDTMPHVLVQTAPGEFTLSRGEWLGRRTGDSETNPFPDFVGSAIRDIAGFQSRLVVVAGRFCCMSQTTQSDELVDYFKKSAVTELVTDPINVTSTGEDAFQIDWVVPFDRDLVLISDPGQSQYIIGGSSRLTPANAAMVKTTAFEAQSSNARPVETGRTVLFPFQSGRFSGVTEFFTNDEVATNGGEDLTETVDRLIPGKVSGMACSTNFKIALFRSDAVDSTDKLYVYKYLWQNTQKLQSAWSYWELPHEIAHVFFSGSRIIVVMRAPSVEVGTVDYVIGAMDLDIPIDDAATYHVCYDRKLKPVANFIGEVSLPYDDAYFVQGDGCLTPGRPVSPISAFSRDASGYAKYRFDTDTVPDGATVIAGKKYLRKLKPTMPRARNRQDNTVLPRHSLIVNGFLIEYRDTGLLTAVMDSRYRADPIEFTVDWFPVDDDPDDPLSIGLRSGVLHVPWGERSDWSELTLLCDDPRPNTILGIDWTGHIYKGSRE